MALRPLFPVLVLSVLTGCQCGPNDGPHSGDPADSQRVDSGESQPPDSLPGDTRDSAIDPYVEPEVYLTPHDLAPGDRATIHYRGELAGQATLGIRYGFNGYNQVEGIDEYLTHTHYANVDYYLEDGMTPADGGFEFELDIPSDARAVHFDFFTGEDPHRVQDDRDGRGYHHGVVFPYIGPYLTWNDQTPAESGVVVNFETSLPCLGTVEYGTDSSLGRRELGPTTKRIHHITLTDLQPDTTYFYRVLDALDRASETYNFRTAAVEVDGFGFLVAADMQDHGDGGDRHWSEVAREMASSHGDAALIVLPGDLALDNLPGDWWTYFDKARELFAGRVLVPSVGNHDTPTDQHDPDEAVFLAYFELPDPFGGDAVYRVDYGPAAFLAFNSEVEDEFASGGRQYVAAGDQVTALATDDAIRWVFAHWHTPPYNAGDRFPAAQQDTIRELTAHFEGTVDWVFTGHEHLYQRSYPLTYEGVMVERYGTSAGQGVGYMVLPPAGIRQYDQVVSSGSPLADHRDWMAYPAMPASSTTVDAELGFVVVSIQDEHITLDCYGMGTAHEPRSAHLLDTVSYSK